MANSYYIRFYKYIYLPGAGRRVGKSSYCETNSSPRWSEEGQCTLGERARREGCSWGKDRYEGLYTISLCEKQGSGESVREEPAGTEQQTSGSSGAAAGSEGGNRSPPSLPLFQHDFEVSLTSFSEKLWRVQHWASLGGTRGGTSGRFLFWISFSRNWPVSVGCWWGPAVTWPLCVLF